MADPALELESEVREELAHARASWVRLAALLHTFREQKAWTLRGCPSFAEWLGQPEIGLGLRQAYSLTGCWRELHVERGVTVERLQGFDPSKLEVVLPAIRGGIELEEALADCETLSRSDLREKYRGTDRGEVSNHQCPLCGHQHAVAGTQSGEREQA